MVVALSAAPGEAAQPNWPATLTLATASAGGTYYAYGAGLARMLTRELNVPVALRTTEGPQENIRLIESGEAQIGFVTMGVALQAWNGTGDWTGGHQFRALRATFPMYDTPFEFVVRSDSGFTSLADLAGKRLGVGPHGGTAGTYLPKFLEVLGIPATLVNGSWAELAAGFEAKTIDLLAPAGGVPFPAVAGLDAKKLVEPLPLTAAQVLALRLAMPELGASVIPAGSYPSLNRSYPTVGLYNFAVVSQDLPSDLVYEMVEAVFDHHDELVQAHPAAAATIPANFVRNGFLPYHPGAMRWYGNAVAPGVMLAD
ncbi:MAG: TAXI family TRAP transporter solute-binding subunit [Azospirillum sp.]|nr:TAXI family TRAP transporter solute-binding subunit [Azospirillum sp.]